MASLSRTPLTPRLVDSLYVEAMVLADEARSYFDGQADQDRQALEPMARVGFACESLKVTTRLMHIIAWLLTQRAVGAGEISAGDACSDERRLGDAPVSDHLLVRKLPAAAQALVRASEELFDRVRRLDRFQAEPAPPVGSPARSLFQRLERSL